MNSTICPKCGKTVPWKKFCGLCGATLPDEPKPILAEPSVPPPKEDLSGDLLSELEEVVKFNPSALEITRNGDVPPRELPSRASGRNAGKAAAPEGSGKLAANPNSTASRLSSVSSQPIKIRDDYNPSESIFDKVQVAATKEKITEEDPMLHKKRTLVLIVIIISTVILLASYMMIFSYKKKNIVENVEIGLMAPTRTSVEITSKLLEKNGCKIKNLDIGAAATSGEEIAEYEKKKGSKVDGATHKIWLSAKCSALWAPFGFDVEAEKLDNLSDNYKGKNLVYDPASGELVEKPRK